MAKALLSYTREHSYSVKITLSYIMSNKHKII